MNGLSHHRWHGVARALCLALAAGLAPGLALGLAPALAEEAPPPAPPALGLTVASSAGAEVITAVVEGPLLSVVAPGGGSLLLLVGGETAEQPNSLVRLRLVEGGEPELTRLRDDLQGGAAILEAVDLDGDGTREVLFGVPGNLYSLGHPHLDEGQPGEAVQTHLLAERGYDPRTRPSDGLLGPSDFAPWYGSAQVGRFETFRLAEPLHSHHRYRLPVQVARTSVGLNLTSERVSVIQRPDGGTLFVSGPEALGHRRLRTVLIDPTLAPDEAGAVEEAWSLLPGAERIEQSWYAWMGKRPVLIVAAQSANKIGIFEKKRLRVFPLRADRTRSGRRPVLDVITNNLRWYPMRIKVADINGDGSEDLVTLQSKGMGAGKLHVEAFLGKSSGRFEPTTKSSTLEVDFAVADLSSDLTGDGRADLICASSSWLRVYPGQEAKRRLVTKKPLWEVPIGELEEERVVAISVGGNQTTVETESPSYDQLATLDIDGDGRAEALLLERAVQGRGVVKIVRFPAEPLD